jgi:catalase
MRNPTGRANYEPNSWSEESGPREAPDRGFRSFPAPEAGDKLRVRSESFADHYSQARQFFISQTPIEQKHLRDALVFELSKVETPKIRVRVVSHLLNIDADLARSVGDGLGLGKLPDPAPAARPTRQDLVVSPALSIVENGPDRFEGRKVGVLMTDGADSALLKALAKALAEEGAVFEVVAPTIAGVTTSDGKSVEAKHKLEGGPSVVFDAVAILISADGAALLARDATARDFVADAFAHAKFIAYVPEARPLLEKAGVAEALDDGCFELDDAAAVADFVESCGELRFWDRELKVDAV